MKPNPDSGYINGFNRTTNNGKKKHQPPVWKWKGLKLTPDTERGLSIADFIHDNAPESVLGPGAGAGVGCGVGVGVGLIGGVGYGGSTWNHVKMVFGFGMGCGVGAGFGYGQGFGVGSSWETLKSRLIKPRPDSNRLLIQL